MADLKKRLANNVSGDFYVDSTCIDCDTCRQLAPQIFEDAGEYSRVYAQPHHEKDVRDATRALLACPTGSIGTLSQNQAKAMMMDFPLLLAESVYYMGFNSPKSYGGNSYLVVHPDGNWLIDAPKFLSHLVKRLEAVGGLRWIFLSHQDDVAEAHRYAEAFGATRIIHEHDRKAQPDAEHIITGEAPVEIHPKFTIIPTPGHTQGHCVLYYKGAQSHFLFTGDHLRWDREHHRLHASKDYCWYDWDAQKQSLAKLLAYDFEWLCPAHGQRIQKTAPEMKAALQNLVDRVNG